MQKKLTTKLEFKLDVFFLVEIFLGQEIKYITILLTYIVIAKSINLVHTRKEILCLQ